MTFELGVAYIVRILVCIFPALLFGGYSLVRGGITRNLLSNMAIIFFSYFIYLAVVLIILELHAMLKRGQMFLCQFGYTSAKTDFFCLSTETLSSLFISDKAIAYLSIFVAIIVQILFLYNLEIRSKKTIK